MYQWRRDGTSYEDRIQRPERPQRANRPPGNTSPSHSSIIRDQTWQNTNRREELPRPNAPLQDENYNNRSISPLFVSQSSSLSDSNYNIQFNVPGPPQHVASTQPCTSFQSRHRAYNVEPAELRSSGTSLNNQEFHYNNLADLFIDNNQLLSNRAVDNENILPELNNVRNVNSLDNTEQQSSMRIQNGIVQNILDHVSTSLLDRLYRFENNRGRDTRTGNLRLERLLRSRGARSGGTMSSSSRSISPVSSTNRNPQLSREEWQVLSGFGMNRRRQQRRGSRTTAGNVEPVPPLINLTEGGGNEQDWNQTYESIQPSSVSDAELTWVAPFFTPTQLQNIQSLAAARRSWFGIEITPPDNIGATEGDAPSITQQNEEMEDNETLFTIFPDHQRSIPVNCHGFNATSSLADVRQLVLSSLECPVCFEYVTPPVVQCCEGHLVCNRCRPRLDHCPECRGPFSSVRPRAVEKIASILEYPCTYEGCKEFLSPANRIIHAKACIFRKFICPIVPSVCSWSGRKEEMRNHVLNFHNPPLLWLNGTKVTFTLQMPNEKEKVFIMEINEHLFHIKFALNPPNKLRGSVTLLGYDETRTESLNVIILVQPIEQPSPSLMVTRCPAEESDEMDMQLEKFIVFNIDHLCAPVGPMAVRIRLAIGNKNLSAQLERLFD